ncbi:hypothetical protein [Bartonella ancashensis]|uniref:Uncharacterized protein n=1 Tax=Bartonella ancashensis TaxID=1318743 RepID=A0A0M4M5Y1_9HYPH|nr:hypothetical protein [Bartonella ancashensis]ALE03542.1 hypothetical protein PU02_0728 [Bartonella ancashensis]
MNTEYRVANLATDDKSSTVGLQRGRDVQSPAEMTISNVSARLRFIYAQMQKKQMQKKRERFV